MNQYGRYFLAAVITAITVFIVLWLADNFSTLIAGLIASVPITMLVIIIFLESHKAAEVSFYLAWGKLAYFIGSLLVAFLIIRLNRSKVETMFIFLAVWIFITGITLWYFNGRLLKDE